MQETDRSLTEVGPPAQRPSAVAADGETIALSIIIPAHNEEGNIERTCRVIVEAMSREDIRDYEILVVDDHSTDGTKDTLEKLGSECASISHVSNDLPPGFGFAVRKGLSLFSGDAACVVMADLSDSPDDIVTYYRKLQEGWECVFGSRFLPTSQIHDYPWLKLVLNRLANWFIKMIFHLDYNDTTNAFKCYRREVIDGVQPILSNHFNLTVELPLKAIARGYRYTIVPISWTNRTEGVSKLKIKEMGSRYLFIVLYVFLEKLLSKGDYHRNRPPRATSRQP